MLKQIAHRIVANPRIYDALQTLLGAQVTARILAAEIAPIKDAPFVLDLGGGTGLYRNLWSPIGGYICLDLDPMKLRGYRSKHSGDFPVLGDVTHLALRTGSIDVAFCSAVSHHIPDDAIASLFSEAARALKVGGHFVFLDALWEPAWLPGRFFWKYDRGSFPRDREMLRSLIARYIDIVQWREYRYFHRYVLCVGINKEHPR